MRQFLQAGFGGGEREEGIPNSSKEESSAELVNYWDRSTYANPHISPLVPSCNVIVASYKSWMSATHRKRIELLADRPQAFLLRSMNTMSWPILYQGAVTTRRQHGNAILRNWHTARLSTKTWWSSHFNSVDFLRVWPARVVGCEAPDSFIRTWVLITDLSKPTCKSYVLRRRICGAFE